MSLSDVTRTLVDMIVKRAKQGKAGDGRTAMGMLWHVCLYDA